MNEMILFFKTDPLTLNTLISESFLLVEASLKKLYLHVSIFSNHPLERKFQFVKHENWLHIKLGQVSIKHATLIPASFLVGWSISEKTLLIWGKKTVPSCFHILKSSPREKISICKTRKCCIELGQVSIKHATQSCVSWKTS